MMLKNTGNITNSEKKKKKYGNLKYNELRNKILGEFKNRKS